MPSKALRVAAVLILAATQTAIVERAVANGAVGGRSAPGHFAGSSHFLQHGFPHGRFGHRFRKQPIFIAPYGWDWPYAGYNEAPSNGNTTIVTYPPPVAPAADNCRWDAETFTVPSSAGGTRPIQVMSCR